MVTMRAVDIIAKKRDGLALSPEEISFFIDGYTRGTIPDYQAAAWCMAVLLRGMTPQETVELTMAMVRSGATVDLSQLGYTVVDKHSTGGVGDKTTLVVAPLVAAAGLPVAKMSGRGLGFSGGTLDKLESIPGFQVSLSLSQFMQLVREQGIVVAGQTQELVPADGKLYALRDVTATVPSMPLIASSIMSKKIAGGAEGIVLDVKVGRGAFMETLEQASELAGLMVDIGKRVGRQVTAVLADMSQPLGFAVGNALEVREAIATLRGQGPADLIEHCLVIGSEMLVLGGVAETPQEGKRMLEARLADGTALETFRRWIRGQGGDERVVDDPSRLPQAPVTIDVSAVRAGYVREIDAREIGLAAVALGAGREKKGDPIDHAVGIVLESKVGRYVQRGMTLFTVHAQTEAQAQAVAQRVLSAYSWSDEPVTIPPLIYDVIRTN